MENTVFTTAAFTQQTSATEKPRGGDTEHAGRVVNKIKFTKHEQNKSNIYLQSHDIKLA
jgi:hypothetical protein